MTPQNELGKLVGELLGKSAGTSYWDNPFQVASCSFLKIRNDKKSIKIYVEGLLGWCGTLQRKSEDDLSTKIVRVAFPMPT